MSDLTNKSKPTEWKTDEDRLSEGIDSLALSVQFALQKAMRDHSLSKTELAKRLNVSAARISQCLGKDASNLTLKTIAKFADAIGEEFEFLSLADINKMRMKEKKPQLVVNDNVINIASFRSDNNWNDTSAANDRFDASDVAREMSFAVRR